MGDHANTQLKSLSVPFANSARQLEIAKNYCPQDKLVLSQQHLDITEVLMVVMIWYMLTSQIPDIILQFLNGTLKIHILGKDENGNEDLCADITLDVVVP